MAVPSDPVLLRQYNKRMCWDEPPPAFGRTDLCGAGCYGDGAFTQSDLDVFKVHPSMQARTPALSLFPATHHLGGVVFRSRQPVLSEPECGRVLEHVQQYIQEELGGVWSTVRKSSVPTTDVAVEDIPALRPWLRELLHSRYGHG